jgi:outer membrane biosynthesis protein TonB
VQVWRTTEFPADAEDSRLELLFEPVGDGTETKVTLIHTNIPEGQGAQYKSGWGEHYFEPMRAYFSETVESAPAPKKATAPKKAAKKKAAPKKAVKKAAAPKKAPKKAAKKAAKKARKKTAAPKKATAPKKAAKKSGKTAPKKKAAAPKKTAKNTAKKAKPRKSARR